MGKNASKNQGSLGKAEYESLSEFRYTIRKFLKFSESAANEVGLTSNQHQALLAIKLTISKGSVFEDALKSKEKFPAL